MKTSPRPSDKCDDLRLRVREASPLEIKKSGKFNVIESHSRASQKSSTDGGIVHEVPELATTRTAAALTAIRLIGGLKS